MALVGDAEMSALRRAWWNGAGLKPSPVKQDHAGGLVWEIRGAADPAESRVLDHELAKVRLGVFGRLDVHRPQASVSGHAGPHTIAERLMLRDGPRKPVSTIKPFLRSSEVRGCTVSK